jgi:hypothetical protein
MVPGSVSFAEAKDIVFNNEESPKNAMKEVVKGPDTEEFLSVELLEYVAGNRQLRTASVAGALYDTDELGSG